MSNQEITLSEGVALTQAFRTQNPGAILAEVSGREILLKILNQTGCKSIRIYKGLDASGNPANVLVGVDEDGNDIVDGVLGNRSVRTIGAANALNS